LSDCADSSENPSSRSCSRRTAISVSTKTLQTKESCSRCGSCRRIAEASWRATTASSVSAVIPGLARPYAMPPPPAPTRVPAVSRPRSYGRARQRAGDHRGPGKTGPSSQCKSPGRHNNCRRTSTQCAPPDPAHTSAPAQ
jgi:hypothetical protein